MTTISVTDFIMGLCFGVGTLTCGVGAAIMIAQGLECRDWAKVWFAVGVIALYGILSLVVYRLVYGV